MYKIYINESTLILLNSADVSEWESTNKARVIAKYRGQRKTILNYVDTMEKSPTPSTIVLHAHKVKKLKKDFNSFYKTIKAAGGLVVNPTQQVMLIFRRGHWDLPKGKLEEGEKKKEGALREVMEETGIKKITIDKKLGNSYHTYKDKKGRRILKVTYWYTMLGDQTDLVPQLDEDIEKAEWVDLDDFIAKGLKTYSNITDILMRYKAMV